MASTRSATTRSTTTSAPAQQQQQQQQSRRGNLGSVLMSYDQSSRGGPDEEQQPRQSMGHRLAIDLPDKRVNAIDDGLDDDDDEDHGEQYEGGGECDDDDNDDRVRSLTLGSEFDLAWITGGMKEGRGMSIGSGAELLTPLGDYNYNNGSNNNANATKTSNESTAMATAMMDDPTVVSSDVCASEPSTTDARRVRTTGGQRWQQQQQHMPARSRGDSTASATYFLNGLFHNHQQPQPPSQVRAHGQHAMTVAHTPPTQMGNSYENSHFGKRMRAGVSILIYSLSF
jgi:hypothetical protein